jgi:crossover junction endodeoxyribonuclease RuvC
MLVAGIDPGGRATAYGILEVADSGLVLVASGVIRVGSNLPFARRAGKIFHALSSVLSEHRPEVVSLESAFYGSNVRTAMMLGRVIGVITLAAAESGADLIEYSPREIKSSVAGSGNATKAQTRFMVGKLLETDPEGLEEDEADALAAAICHLNRCKVL